MSVTTSAGRATPVRYVLATPEAIYGTILVTGVLAGTKPGVSASEVFLSGILASTAIWVAHVVAVAIATHGVRATRASGVRASLSRALTHSSGILIGPLVPIVILAGGAADVEAAHATAAAVVVASWLALVGAAVLRQCAGAASPTAGDARAPACQGRPDVGGAGYVRSCPIVLPRAKGTVLMQSSERPGAGVVWSRVEEGFHVGSRGGVFLGYIDRQSDGSLLAFDGRSRLVGRFSALTAAMAAVTNGQPPQDREITLDEVRVPSPRSVDGAVR